ncbi:asparagine synthase (glutamine-hydrolyzing) [Candidatus Desulforudis audaxviator]|uniref:asparagine synthase (glutamine-hydrolyzing) n=1 Tax=Desulforudis audaxviator (strain MP104C) TaxID=477974 RepID=B1I0Y5_DESAP|nr:asparagine synthase (glutamine-hydrolyzing) [Candidatus Desulforudis audaxviator]ACA58708.1 asparagine synthase (glutamine-hydrolyzing) [Candidatus Desulforudis audaxviator MP104C]AZK58709.1 Asparagine synthetase [glutamine-hydrolyzing] [Candidatus Desulforudis audaxviator]
MCGIAGWIDWERDLRRECPVITEMTGTLAARGPDASGFWLSEHAALGHRRLIVVDPEGGGQPMVRRCGEREYVLVYNGELYNTPELRRDLEARGHVFRGHSDTEALLLSYIEWGADCVGRLNGIFAFAVWSEYDQSLFMARDRMGVKPLFYAVRGGAFLFGSEQKAILAHPDVRPEVDAEGLAEVFALGPARTPGHGVFRGISELRPGYCLFFDRNGVRTRRYWRLESRPHTDDLPATAAKVRALLQDSVERQLVADVPVCTLLSGGLDSSALTAFAAGAFRKSGRGTVHTYSIDFVDNERYFRPNRFQPDADSAWVGLVSDRLGTIHHPVWVDTPELVDTLGLAVQARDLPGMADIDTSLYLFCREIKKEFTVALSGECADEMFGGYPWFHREEDLAAGTFPWSRSTRARMRLLKPELARELRPEEYVAARYAETLAEVPRLSGEDPVGARRREMFYLNLVWFMTTLLDRKDRMSMATGLEVRVPFCDHRLVEYVWNIPWALKTWGGREKGILRLALDGVVPGEVLHRRKSPYPKTHHPGYLEAVRSKLRQVLDDPASPLLTLIDTTCVRELVQTDGSSFGTTWFGQLMAGPQLFAYLYQVDAWLREYRVTIR